MTDAKIHESIWIALDEGLLEELRAFGKSRGLLVHDVARVALRLGVEILQREGVPHPGVHQRRLPEGRS